MDEAKEKAECEHWGPICLFFIIGILIVIFWGFGGGFNAMANDNRNVESIESLFTGLAFLGMMIAIYFQKEELKLQRLELAETRIELHRSAVANEQAAKLAKENIDEQKKIADIRNSYTRNQILAQKYIAQLNNIYKEIEFRSGSDRGPFIIERKDEIDDLIKKLENLKALDAPIS